jgi:hypothetical protein
METPMSDYEIVADYLMSQLEANPKRIANIALILKDPKASIHGDLIIRAHEGGVFVDIIGIHQSGFMNGHTTPESFVKIPNSPYIPKS